MDKKLASIIKYFAVFDYFPSLADVYTFFPEKISKKKLKNIIEAKKNTPLEYRVLSQKSKIKNQKFNSKVKSNNETMKQWNNLIKKKQISKTKLNSWKFKLYIKFLALFPQIKLVGLSGSIAMMNAAVDDDIDLFIITAKNRLFTGRFLATTIAFIMGLKRGIGQEKAPNKVCLNLFFDEANLKVPKSKETEFVAHEILQMKPIISKGNVYERFLKANLWVQDIFPNSSWMISKIKDQRSKTNSKFKSLIFKLGFDICAFIFDLFEKIVKKIQLSLINRHRTTELISNSQLWFHPVDFGKKIKKTIL
jgi:hypothetical protein